MKDYYKILGVDEKINQEALKKTYRKLAQEYHPDKNPGDEQKAEKFKDISEAHATLSDPQRRAQYDAMRKGMHHGMPPGFGFGNSFEDIFSNVFGSEPFGQRMHRQKKQQASPVINFDIPLSELKSGHIKRIFNINTSVECNSCEGKGGKSVERCRHCQGGGTVHQTSRQGNSFFQRISDCPICQGRGKVILGECSTCRGNGNVLKTELYSIDIICKLQKP